ncbi:related to Polyphosphatidylinositol phosphatase INP53 [Zygosaccharomyces bailii]|nr:related to Polyphosphatidylinositol phosphatase INP53 [Zygosaccharomyces bailii]
MLVYLSTKPERRIAIISESFALILKSVGDDPKNRPRCAVELLPKSELSHQGFKKLSSHELYGFIGLIEVEGLIFVGAITGKSKVAQPTPGETVNKIYAVDFFCLNSPRWDFVEIDSSGYPILSENDPDYSDSYPRHPCHELKKLLSNGSFYFSSDFDLTSTLQHRGFGEHSLSVDNFREEYMWNYFLMQEIITYRDRLDANAKQVLDEQGFLTTVIRGFAETFVTYIKKLKVGVTVISKQSWKRAGTRFIVRGVDDEGNVANFVETEFIMYSSQYCYAFTQIRGSIPVFWEQDTSLINPRVQITRSVEATQPIFDQHFLRLKEEYGSVHVVNLLSTKSSEIELSQRYRQHLRNSKKVKLGQDVFLTEFDFHRETAQEGFSAVRRLIPKIIDSLLVAGYFSYDVREKRLISEQQGVFRTNCLDCLDRTNLVQQVLSLTAFKTFLEDFHLISPKSYIENEDFVNKHNTLWADHGDQISQIYTGTNALKSSFSRKGKMSFAGALSDATKSVSRMYINNFMDKGKQQNIDSLLGRLPHQHCVQLYDPISEYVHVKLKGLSDQFTSHSTTNILVGTYNVNGTSRHADLSKWLFPIGDKFKPDIVVLGLQEVIELSAGSLLNADYSKGSFWENMVNKCLNQYSEKYLLLRVEQMSSLIILFFVKADKAHMVKQVEGATKKTGFGGITGNKGAVAIRFEYGDTSFCFVNAHFAAGSNNIDERRNDYESIVKSISFTRSKTIPHHDSIFWLGDLNYRIILPNEEVRKELADKKEGYIERLLRYDQLTQEINTGVVFQGFREPTLKFRPTYKYDNSTDVYDTSEKARTPSWTDRIVYKGSNLHPLAYADAHLTISDHRPVYAAYRAKVTLIDENVRLDLTNRLYKEYKKAHPEEASLSNNHLLDVHSEKSPINAAEGHNPFNRTSPSFDLLDLHGTPKSKSPSPSSVGSSLSPELLPPRKQGSVSPLGDSVNNKPKVRPPPPPASRLTSSSKFLHNSATDSAIITSNKVSATDTAITSSKVSASSASVENLSSAPPPPPPQSRKSLPPGFNETILTPKTPSRSNTPTVANVEAPAPRKAVSFPDNVRSSSVSSDSASANSPQPHLELSNTDSDLASLSKRKGPPIPSRSPSVRKEVTNTATAVSAPPLVPKKKKPPVPSHALESAVQYPHTNAAEAASSEMTASEKDSPALSDKNQPTEPTLMPKDTNSSTSVTLIPKKKAPPVPSHSNGSVQSINTGTEFGPSNSQDDKTLSAPLPSSFPSGSNNSTAKDVAAKVVASNASDILAPKKDDTLMSPQSSGLTQPPLPADKEPGTVKKSPPAKPAKKPELEHLSLHSWKPLTPK